MTISFSNIRSAISTQINTIPDFHISKIPPEFFGRTVDTIAHKAFTVQIASIRAMPERQRLSVGVYCQTNIIVKFAYRLRPHDSYPTDYDLSFDTLQLLVDKVLSSYSIIQPGLVGRFDSASVEITSSIEWAIHTSNFIFYNTI